MRVVLDESRYLLGVQDILVGGAVAFGVLGFDCLKEGGKDEDENNRYFGVWYVEFVRDAVSVEIEWNL